MRSMRERNPRETVRRALAWGMRSAKGRRSSMSRVKRVERWRSEVGS
jgi:hypothetical protein